MSHNNVLCDYDSRIQGERVASIAPRVKGQPLSVSEADGETPSTKLRAPQTDFGRKTLPSSEQEMKSKWEFCGTQEKNNLQKRRSEDSPLKISTAAAISQMVSVPLRDGSSPTPPPDSKSDSSGAVVGTSRSARQRVGKKQAKAKKTHDALLIPQMLH
jgi:hypothetical protein